MRRKFISIMLALFMLLPMFSATGVTVSAYVNVPVSYRCPVYNIENDPTSGIKEWKTKICNQNSSMSESRQRLSGVGLEGGVWYIVDDDITMHMQLILMGDVNIILKDGCTMRTEYGIIFEDENSSLTVYAQSDGDNMGSLISETEDEAAIGGIRNKTDNGSITINGGNIIATTGGKSSAAIGGLGANKNGSNITINGGKITATAAENGAGIGGGAGGAGKNITINGGTVIATSVRGSGIGSGFGSYSSASDIIINGGVITSSSTLGVYPAIGASTAQNIRIASDMTILADNKNPPVAQIQNDGSDISSVISTRDYNYVKIGRRSTVSEAECENGSVSVGNNKIYYEGETVTVTPTANTEYIVDKVYYNDDAKHEITPVGGVYSFRMPAKAVTVSATFKLPVPDCLANAKYYASLTLNNDIAVNFKVDKTGDGFDYRKMTVCVGDDTYSLDENYTCKIASKTASQMGDTFAVKVKYDGVTVKMFNYSVKKYCDSVITNSDDTELADLCKAVLNYGAWAENYNNKNEASTVNANCIIDFSDYEFTDIPEFSFTKSSAVTKATASLALNSSISMIITITSTKALKKSDIKVTNNLGEDVPPQNIIFDDYQNGRYDIVIKNISASRISRSYTFKCASASITYSAFNFVNDIQSKTGKAYTDTLKTLCKAIHNYGVCAKAYNEANGGK